MSLTVFLDSGPLSLITSPKKTPDTIAVVLWVIAIRAAGHRFIVPAIADYEVRRELIRAGKPRSIAQLDVRRYVDEIDISLKSVDFLRKNRHIVNSAEPGLYSARTSNRRSLM